ncbi:hypothetical protein [Novosphingobium sp.]|uniref:hypothetical protein n=1 Tax=Novosphingobium sp. TaxID=1874826 RepID=UPI002B4A6C3C|nr:hypothetical protein [Novosphingobium sp.]HKR93060.1 hypothetical protein [Novosphingobium sp.]
MSEEIDYCKSRIASEEKLAEQAPSPEAAESHWQLAMLYRVQLNLLTRGTRMVAV